MEVNFSKNNGGVGASPAPIINVESQTTPVPDGVQGVSNPPGPVGVPATTRNNSFISGDDLPGFRDVMLPRLNLVHDIGALKETFSPGELVWGQQNVLFTPPAINKQTGNVDKPGTPPVIITVLGEVNKRFSEIIEGGMGGAIVATEADVRASGGTLDYNEYQMKKGSGMKRFGPLLDLLVVVQRPEHVTNDGTVFGFDVGGAQYALGLWSLSKTSYTEGYKKSLGIHRLTGVIKGKRSEGGGYPVFSFAVSTRLHTYPKGNKSWVPVVIPFRKSTPEFLDFVNQIINPLA